MKVTEKERNKIILENYPRIKIISNVISRKINNKIPAEDLIHAGVLGLIRGINTYKVKGGASFKTFSEITIKGEMFEYVRNNDFISKGDKVFSKDIEKAKTDLKLKLGRDPYPKEISKVLKIPLHKYYKIRKIIHDAHIKEDFKDYHTESYCFNKIKCDGNRKIILKILKERLPLRSERIIYLYYFQGLAQKQIGKKLGLTTARVSQIIGRTLKILRNSKELKELKGLLADE